MPRKYSLLSPPTGAQVAAIRKKTEEIETLRKEIAMLEKDIVILKNELEKAYRTEAEMNTRYDRCMTGHKARKQIS